MSNQDITEVITIKNLQTLAGGRSYERGEEYFEEGAVGPVSENSGAISAKVHGSRTYNVRLKVVAGKAGETLLDYTCTCPVGRDGGFCKHCVALGLAWLDNADEIEGTETDLPTESRKPITDADIRIWLGAQDTETILDLLMAQVSVDGPLRDELVLKISKENEIGIDLNAYRKGLRAAFHTGGFVDYDDMYEYSNDIDTELDKLERLLEEGFASETMHLCECAFELADDAMQNCDDSSGYFSSIAERLGALHLDACLIALPNPTDLARRLFAIELKNSDLDFCSGAADIYQEVLGKEGLAEYRRLAEAEWARATAKGSTPSHTITTIMESLARADGDVDALIAIKKRTLTAAYNYLVIADICRKAGRADQALEWAELGVQTFPKNTDSRLLDFLAEEYHHRKRYDDACRQYWAQFAERLDLPHYIKLLDYATKIERHPKVRDEALTLLRAAVQREKISRRDSWGHVGDHSRLVEIFLWENDVEAAWKEANSGGCSDQLWLKLAAAREKEHPADAVPVYQRLIEPIITRMNNGAYEEATRMVKHIRDLLGSMGRQAEFAAYLAEVKLRHKPKRNLMKLLAGV